MRKLTKEQYRGLTAAKVTAAEAVLAGEVAGLVTGEDWRQFLDCQAKLHDLDAHNVLLVVAQHRNAYEQGRVPDPAPSYVAGFDTWKALGRHVERGQHGYTTLAPRNATPGGVHDEVASRQAVRRGEQPDAGETEAQAAAPWGARPETVFALSQTAGREVVERARPTLGPDDAPPGLKEVLLELIEARGWKVTTVSDATSLEGADSRTYYGGRFINVRADLDDATMVKTLIHQAAHVLVHGGPPGRYLPQTVKEVEADSVAYVVAAAHAMSTEGYRFPEVAGWAGEQADKAVRGTQARISRAAQAIIAASPAEHEPGSKPPGADLALAAMRQIDQEAAARRAELLDRMAGRGEIPEPAGADRPQMA
jgi:hypothetical protein